MINKQKYGSYMEAAEAIIAVNDKLIGMAASFECAQEYLQNTGVKDHNRRVALENLISYMRQELFTTQAIQEAVIRTLEDSTLDK